VTALVCQAANAALGSSRTGSTPQPTSWARTNPTACGALGAVASRPAWLTSIAPLINPRVTQKVGVCIQRSIEVGLLAAAIHARNGASAATAAGSPVSASSSTAARSMQASRRSRRRALATAGAYADRVAAFAVARRADGPVGQAPVRRT
jgi:hypothetical protein